MARDIELHALNTLKLKEDSLHLPGSSWSMREPDYNEPYTEPILSRIWSSFKRHPDSRYFEPDPLGHRLSADQIHDGAHYYDLRQATLESAHTTLARKLKSRHLQMIAIGGSIGV
jgi:yeast amino acid transporter